MGGEPTFVSATDMDADEWNTDALGPTKRILAGRLIRRLGERWSPGPALQYGVGKHYPGEQLPRWALHCHWRGDGEPVWRDRELLASDDDTDTATPEDAARFGQLLAERLQVDPGLVRPAYEDVHYYLWREHRLPGNVLVEDAKLKDPLERARLAQVFGHGLSHAVGSVLPLRRVSWDGGRRWQSGRWFFRCDLLFLVPGDSSIGFRLPLDACPGPIRTPWTTRRRPILSRRCAARCRRAAARHTCAAAVLSHPSARKPSVRCRRTGMALTVPTQARCYGKLPGRADYGVRAYGAGERPGWRAARPRAGAGP